MTDRQITDIGWLVNMKRRQIFIVWNEDDTELTGCSQSEDVWRGTLNLSCHCNGKMRHKPPHKQNWKRQKKRILFWELLAGYSGRTDPQVQCQSCVCEFYESEVRMGRWSSCCTTLCFLQTLDNITTGKNIFWISFGLEVHQEELTIQHAFMTTDFWPLGLCDVNRESDPLGTFWSWVW